MAWFCNDWVRNPFVQHESNFLILVSPEGGRGHIRENRSGEHIIISLDLACYLMQSILTISSKPCINELSIKPSGPSPRQSMRPAVLFHHQTQLNLGFQPSVGLWRGELEEWNQRFTTGLCLLMHNNYLYSFHHSREKDGKKKWKTRYFFFSTYICMWCLF